MNAKQILWRAEEVTSELLTRHKLHCRYFEVHHQIRTGI
jgi:hypothetical protein